MRISYLGQSHHDLSFPDVHQNHICWVFPYHGRNINFVLAAILRQVVFIEVNSQQLREHMNSNMKNHSKCLFDRLHREHN